MNKLKRENKRVNIRFIIFIFWVMNMLLNPAEMLKKDPIAIALLKEYNNIMMLNQNLTNDEARSISEYLRTL